MRGRSQKTPKEKALSGKPPNVPQPDVIKALKCPSWMPLQGKRLWKNLSGELIKVRALTVLDVSSFEALCLSYALMRKSAYEMLKDGFTVPGDKGTIKKHPSFSIYKSNSDTFRRFAEQFGLSPASRQRLDMPEPPGRNRWNHL